MSYHHFRALPSFAVLAIVGAAIAGVPTPAIAQTAGGSPAAADAGGSHKKPIEKAEARIADLHTKLEITKDQEPQWNKLAEVIHDNAEEMSGAIKKREQAEKTASALDDLKAYQLIAEAHSDGLKKLVPAFETLYGVLSDSQKKTADEMFSRAPGRKS